MHRAAAAALVLAASLVAAPEAGTSISGKAAKRWTAKIASLGQRPAGGAHVLAAGDLVKKRLRKLGYDTRSQWFRLPSGKRDRNVVGKTPGTTRVILVAHVDGVYDTRAANDNASGVGLVLELARALRNRRGVLVAALGAEERAVTGSQHHLGSLRLLRTLDAGEKKRVRLALSLDMVGVGTSLHVRGIETAPNRSARKALAAARAREVRASYLQDTGQSDHAEMSRAGLPAAWLQWRWDECWHLPCDRSSRVRPWKLNRAGRLTAAGARAVLP